MLGVFIGLQVNNWNTARKDRIAERQYLVRLHHDIAENQKTSSYLAERHLRRAATLKALWMYAEKLRSDPPDKQAVDYALCRWFVMPVMHLQYSTYKELVMTGNFTLIRNQKLRQLIQNAYAEHENTRRQINLFGDTVRNLGEKLDGDMEWRLLPTSKLQRALDPLNPAPGASRRVDFAKLKNPGIPSVLVQLYRAEKIFGRYRRTEAEADKRAASSLARIIESKKERGN